MNALVPHTPANAEIYRASTDAAGLCREIVLKTAMEIQKRKYVKVEGWQAIAIAHGCTGSARDVEKIEGGVRAIGEIRRMSDGALIAQAEGFVGEDEPTWYGGEAEVWEWGDKRGERRKVLKVLTPRPAYAIRAMAQTRAISRACRSAFAHVVVLIDANLSTTPAEEVPMGGFDDEPRGRESRNVTPCRDEPPQEGNAALTAAMTSITLCNSTADLKEWKARNAEALAMFSDDDQNTIVRHFNDRVSAVKPRPADKREPERVLEATGSTDPFDDEIPF